MSVSLPLKQMVTNTSPPWQWPTDTIPAPIVVPFSRSLDGRPADWEALVFPVPDESLSHIYLRPANRDDLFCVCDSEGNIAVARLSYPLDGWEVRMVCAEAFTHSKIARLFFLGEPNQLRNPGEFASASVSIRSNGRGQWNSRPTAAMYLSAQNRAPFRLFDEMGVGAFMRRPALDVWRELKTALASPESDTAFARDWTRKSEEQRDEALWNWPPANREERRAEFQGWLRCILLSQESLWQSDETWTLSVPDNATIWLTDDDFEEHAISGALRSAVEQLWHHFQPFKAEVLAHDCAFEWKQGTIEPFLAEAHQPSAHERLEAMMSWRDWQAEHGE